MNWLDYAFLGVIGISVLIGLIRGFVREVVSVVVWVAAFWIAFRYGAQAGASLSPWLGSSMLQLVAGFGGLFVLTLLVGALVGYVAKALVGKTGLTGTDRVLGVVFGGLRGGLLVGLLILGAGLTALPREPWWQASMVVQGYQPVVCHRQVGRWLEQARAVAPVAEAPVNGAIALAYWEAYCAANAAPLNDNGSGS